MKILTDEQIRALNISPEESMEWIRQSFLMKDRSRLKAKISLCPRGSDFFNTMPCILPEGYHTYGVKVVSRIKGNEPSLRSKLFLFDTLSGEMIAMMDADWITSMRTGAVAALAIKTLRKNDAQVYALMGLGNIGHYVMECLITTLPNDRVTRFKLLKYKDQAEKFADYYGKYKNISFEIVDDVNTFTSDSDVIVSCITQTDELIEPDTNLFKPGCLVVPVHTRGFQNCDLVFDKVYGDDTDHIKGFRYFSRFRHFAELSSVLKGESEGRSNDNERILSYNIGLGLHDVVWGYKILRYSNKIIIS